MLVLAEKLQRTHGTILLTTSLEAVARAQRAARDQGRCERSVCSFLSRLTLYAYVTQSQKLLYVSYKYKYTTSHDMHIESIPNDDAIANFNDASNCFFSLLVTAAYFNFALT